MCALNINNNPNNDEDVISERMSKRMYSEAPPLRCIFNVENVDNTKYRVFFIKSSTIITTWREHVISSIHYIIYVLSNHKTPRAHSFSSNSIYN